MIFATRYHDFSAGHRVVGHESKCRWMHGHNYRVTFTLGIEAGELDAVGRVLDFGVIKTTLCQWLEENWDHKFLMWEKDPLREFFELAYAESGSAPQALVESLNHLCESFTYVPFNPTAENMALYLVGCVGPELLAKVPARLMQVEISETRKCSAVATL